MTGCASALRGAVYATSEVTVTTHSVTSWHRGLAGDGTQIWGATAGGHVFDRVLLPEQGVGGVPKETPSDGTD